VKQPLLLGRIPRVHGLLLSAARNGRVRTVSFVMGKEKGNKKTVKVQNDTVLNFAKLLLGQTLLS